MLLSILLVFLYTSLTYFIWTPKVPFIKNKILKISFSWFLGQFFSTTVIFLLANLLTLFTTQVLYKSSLIYLVFLILIAIFVYRRAYINMFKKATYLIINKALISDLIIALLCFLTALMIFLPHLSYRSGKIYRSEIYWDILWNILPIQGFVHGDNFPPQNESFAGFPLIYHYFFWLAASVYSSLGLNVAYSVNFISIVSFFFLLLAIYGFSQEFFSSRLVGVIAIFLTLTTGSLRFIYDFERFIGLSLFEVIKDIFTKQAHPGFFSMLGNYGNPFGYNGQMLNIFYFIAERQLILSAIFLVFFVVIIYHRKHLSDLTCFVFGLFLGSYFFWQSFSSLLLPFSVLIIFLFDKYKRKTLYILAGLIVSLGLVFIYLQIAMMSEWIMQGTTNLPVINFNFTTIEGSYPFSLLNALKYYIFAYGLKTVFIAIGLFLIWRKDKSFLKVLISIIIISFLFINTLQITPTASIYENHKWLRPLNVFLDILISYALVKLASIKKSELVKLIIIYSLIIMSLSGLIELMPFVNSKPNILIGNEKSDLVIKIRQETKPKDIFLTKYQDEVQLAGRKVFLKNASLVSLINLDVVKRLDIIKGIYNSQSLDNFCKLTSQYGIDYVEFEQNPYELAFFVNPLYFEAISEDGKNLYYLDTKTSCQI